MNYSFSRNIAIHILYLLFILGYSSNTYSASKIAEELNKLELSMLTLDEFSSQSYLCKAFPPHLAQYLSARIEKAFKVDGVNMYYSFDTQKTMWRHALSKITGERFGADFRVDSFYPDAADANSFRYACNNPLTKVTPGEGQECVFCKYKSGMYLQAIYDQDDIQATLIGAKYTDPFERSNAINAKLDFFAGAGLGLQRMSLIEEILALYMRLYSKEPYSCFRDGAIKRTITIDHGDMVTYDEYGWETDREDLGTSQVTFYVNPEFIQSCRNLCESVSQLYSKAKIGGVFENGSTEYERQRVIQLFSDVKQFINDTSCGSDERRKFEEGLLALYQGKPSGTSSSSNVVHETSSKQESTSSSNHMSKDSSNVREAQKANELAEARVKQQQENARRQAEAEAQALERQKEREAAAKEAQLKADKLRQQVRLQQEKAAKEKAIKKDFMQKLSDANRRMRENSKGLSREDRKRVENEFAFEQARLMKEANEQIEALNREYQDSGSDGESQSSQASFEDLNRAYMADKMERAAIFDKKLNNAKTREEKKRLSDDFRKREAEFEKKFWEEATKLKQG